jgi:carboxylate-amine ligase
MQLKAETQGMTFGVSGGHRTFPIDALPRVVASYEWESLVEGLIQRARAIEHFLRDIYGPGNIVREGVMTEEFVRARPGYRPEGRRLPRDAVRAAVCGFDLVREPLGGWRVIEDNVRTPSGLAYAIGLRRLVAEVFPELSEGVALRQPDDVIRLLGDTLRACSEKDDPLIVLLSGGPSSSAWFEHRILAEEAGLLLVMPSELEVEGGTVTAGGRSVDVLYHRLDVELADLTGPAGEPLGSVIAEAVADGRLSVVNAPGNGVADDKAMYCYVPDMINFYLGEKPKIPSVPTYRCSDPDECKTVLARLDELVTKPVDGDGGHGILIGPDAGPEELRERAREIREDGDGWVAQETLELSTVPTLAADGLEPRFVDLRAFVLLTGTGAEDACSPTVALTRVAPAGSRIVNSSQGGGAKDTWILDSVELP